MGRINKKKKETPEISTASLPDIIFILLFFFMVVTVMRKNDLLVKTDTPQATELTKIKYKQATAYIFIGTPMDTDVNGTAPRIQLNDALRPKTAVQPYIKEQYELVPDGLKGQFIVSLRVDKEATMGIVSDVKQELRKADALKINYSSKVRIDE